MYKYIKRFLDIIFAIILLIFSSIPMGIIALLIKKEDKGNIIYKSKRVGKNCKLFNVYKFRTMKMNRKELEANMSHDQMVTKVGKILRKTSLDELPQLFNILKGEMSFIGPRPWIEEYYEKFTSRQKQRSAVVPGISGLAQVKGRNGIDILTKIAYDLYYIEHMNIFLDIKILFLTAVSVFKASNAEISEQGIKKELEQLEEQDNIIQAV